jgi:hypothetical protein
LQEAERKGIATVVLTNSWKDVYAHPYVDVPAGWIGVAGEREAAHLRCASPHLRADRIAVVGSLHLEHFLRRKPIPGRAEFCRGAGLDPVRPFLCYTAASPQVAAGEESIVHTLLEAVEHHPARPQVLLRLNPRENGERFRTLQARFPDCIIQRPVWEWDANKDWNAPLREDLELWIATVHHAAFNVSIPSTVSFEFAAMGRLVVNVCFGGESPARCANTWDAPFYRQIRKSPFVAGAFSVDEFREMVAARLSEPGAWRLAPPRPVASPVDEAEKLVWAALEGRGKCRPMELQLGVDHAARRVAARTGARAPAATGAGTNDRASALHLQ